MTSPWDVLTIGTDSSGRVIRMTRFMKAAFDLACHDAKVTPTIVQGPFQGSGGADASAGTHAAAGCIDTRTWDLTDDENQRFIRACRAIGVAAYFRGPPSFDEHDHSITLGDRPMHADAAAQAREYIAGGDGLVGTAPDPHWRPSPLVTVFDYAAATQQEDEMQLNDKLFPDRADSPTIRESLVAANQANAKVGKVLDRLSDYRKVAAERDNGLATDLERLLTKVGDDATRDQVARIAKRLRGQDDDGESADGPKANT